MKSYKYEVVPLTNYGLVEFNNKRKAFQYARSITDSLNHVTKVVTTVGNLTLAEWRYTPEMGGRVFRAYVY